MLTLCSTTKCRVGDMPKKRRLSLREPQSPMAVASINITTSSEGTITSFIHRFISATIINNHAEKNLLQQRRFGSPESDLR